VNGNNQWEWEGNGNKTRLNMGLGMGMERIFPLISTDYLETGYNSEPYARPRVWDIFAFYVSK